MKALTLIGVLLLSGCVGTYDPTERGVQGAAGGAAMGCAVGAAATIWLGPVAAVGCGVGAMMGAGGGAMIGVGTAPPYPLH